MEEATKVSFRRELDALTTIRDELKLKAHLASADIKDELQRLDTKWQGVETELARGAAHLKQPVDVIEQGTRELLIQLKQSYENIKRKLA